MVLPPPELELLPPPGEAVGSALLGKVVTLLPDDELDVSLPLPDGNFD